MTRYYKLTRFLYSIDTDFCYLVIGEDGLIRFFGELPGQDDVHEEIYPPDPGPIEERYINATDRPSVDGFKYPELHPVNDVES